ncbi:MAG TPA: cadherin-like domain-containing protein [Steroidobacteraceae bacterium]|nr:cadherin-like domain-containing protein [Steroidobacteraceae bacterium]
MKYDPNRNFRGTDRFTYTIADGRGGTATATVTVIVH